MEQIIGIICPFYKILPVISGHGCFNLKISVSQADIPQIVI